jgi:hypothetical protein
VEIHDVSVSVTGTVGVLVSGIASLTVENLDLTGNVTEAEKDGVPPDPDSTRYAVVGMAVVKTGQADISALTAQGFAAYGVVLFETDTSWDGGEVHHLVGTGIQAAGPAEVSLANLNIHHVWQGATPFGYGIVASHDVHLVTENVTIEDNGLAGLLMDHATGEHRNITISRNGSRGAWLQNCHPRDRALGSVAVGFMGDGNHLDDNSGVAFGVFNSSGVLLENAEINNTAMVTMVALDAGQVEIGDGIEIVGSTDLEFSNVSLDNNARAGVVIDGRTTELSESDTQVAFNQVEISGDGDRGFQAQNGSPSSEPDVVSPGLQAADAVGGFLDVASAVDTANIPAPAEIIDVDI